MLLVLYLKNDDFSIGLSDFVGLVRTKEVIHVNTHDTVSFIVQYIVSLAIFISNLDVYADPSNLVTNCFEKNPIISYFVYIKAQLFCSSMISIQSFILRLKCYVHIKSESVINRLEQNRAKNYSKTVILQKKLKRSGIFPYKSSAHFQNHLQ